jgi:sugar (pentulose or hexulose) kinase
MQGLVLNLGLKSIRSIVFNEQGAKLASHSLPVNTYLKGAQVEQDPDEWWDKAVAVIRRTLEDCGPRREVACLTVTASSSCLVSVDREGKPLHRAIMVSDKRALEQAEAIARMPEFARCRAETGYTADPYLLLPKILWLRQHAPEVFERAHRFLSANAFLIHRLTGRCVTDPFDAEKYFYNPETSRHAVELLDKLGLPVSSLPEVLPCGADVGTVEKACARTLELSDRTRVVLSSYDAICAFFGSGAFEDGEACDVSGTVTSFRVNTRRRAVDPQGRVFTQKYVDKGIYIVGGSNNLGGGLIEWTKQCFFNDEKHPYELMEKEASESPLGAKGLICLPYLMGERAPLWDIHARGVFFGLERHHRRGDMARAIFESTGFSLLGIQKIIEGLGVDVRHIRMSGGLSRLKLICQLKADITGKEVLVLDEFESTALGAFILAMVGQRVFASFADASRLVSVREIVLPNPARHARYAKVYTMFVHLYERLKGSFEERQALLNDIYEEKTERIENL